MYRQVLDLYATSADCDPKSAESVAEAEAGYDVAAMKKRGRGRPGRGEAPSQVVAVRFTPEELATLDARAEARHMTRSALIREAALA